MNCNYLVCQDVTNWLLNNTYPDVLDGKLTIFVNSSKVYDFDVRLESQDLNEAKYYYNYSKDDVLSSPSDLLGVYI